jgi:hypothetical protein
MGLRMSSKVCSKCKEAKAFSEYCKDSGQKSGLYPSCKACAKVVKDAYLLKEGVREKNIARSKAWQEENKDRAEETKSAWLRNNKEKASAISLAWQKRNRKRVNENYKRYYEKNKEAIKAKKILAIASDLPKDAAKSALRRFGRAKATPSWANKFFMAEAYRLAALREQMFGFKWHVDHIVPLKGKKVCGLHVENNLQVIPAVENIRKNNHFAGE